MEDVLSDWEHLLSSSAPSLLPPATTLTTSYTSHDSFLTVFPPVNHEGLPVAPLANSHRHDSPSTATSAAMTKTSSASPPLPLPTDFHNGDSTIHKHSLYSRSPSPISPLAGWIGLALQLLKSKVISAFSSVRSRVSLVPYPSESPVSIGGLMTGASLTGLGLWIWWRRRRRRPRGSRDDTIEHLNLLIREKDEKIIELLLQVAQLNKLLLARYRVPVVKEC